jgi:quercetin dioxygenase-like cupin family protein
MDLDQAAGTPATPEPGAWWAHRVWPQLVGDPEAFARHWGRAPLVRRTANDLAAVFDAADAERLLSTGLRRPAFRLIRDGASLPDSTGCRPTRIGGRLLDDVADPARIADAIAAGATLVLQSLQRVDARVASFASALAGPSGHGVQVNAYLSPPGARGLGRHCDAHDVLVLQVDGTKHWTVDGLGDVRLDPGSVMYVPADVAHAACTHDRPSLHLTVGIFPVTRRQLIERVLAAVPELDVRLPPWFATDDPAATAAELELAISAAATALTAVHVDTSARAELDRARTRTTSAAPGWLRSPLAAIADHDVHGATTLELRPGCTLAPRPPGTTTSVLHLGSRALTMPDVAETALVHLLDHGASRVGDLPGLDRDSRLVLARRLLRERFAVVARTPAGHAETDTTVHPEA